jgi:hypothetical protein
MNPSSKSLILRLAWLVLCLCTLIGIFKPTPLETVMWLHLEVVVLAGLLLLTSFTGNDLRRMPIQVLTAALIVATVSILIVVSWLIASLLFTGGGELKEGSERLHFATHVLLEDGLFAGLSAIWRALGPGAYLMALLAFLFHLVRVVVQHVQASRAFERDAPMLDPSKHATARERFHLSTLLIYPLLDHSAALFVISLFAIIPVGLALLGVDESSAWPTWFVVISVRLGVEVWCSLTREAKPRKTAKRASGGNEQGTSASRRSASEDAQVAVARDEQLR